MKERRIREVTGDRFAAIGSRRNQRERAKR